MAILLLPLIIASPLIIPPASLQILSNIGFNSYMTTNFPDIGIYIEEKADYDTVEQHLDQQTSIETANLLESIQAFMIDFYSKLPNSLDSTNFTKLLNKHFPNLTPDTITEILKLNKFKFANNLGTFHTAYENSISHEIGHNIVNEISNSFFNENKPIEKVLIALKIMHNHTTINKIANTIISAMNQGFTIGLPIAGVTYSQNNKEFDKSNIKYKYLRMLSSITGVVSEYHSNNNLNLFGGLKDFNEFANIYISLKPIPDDTQLEQDLTSIIYLANEIVLANHKNISNLSKIITSKSYILNGELQTFYNDSPVVIPPAFIELITTLENQNIVPYIPSNRNPVLDEKLIKPMVISLKNILQERLNAFIKMQHGKKH